MKKSEECQKLVVFCPNIKNPFKPFPFSSYHRILRCANAAAADPRIAVSGNPTVTQPIPIMLAPPNHHLTGNLISCVVVFVFGWSDALFVCFQALAQIKYICEIFKWLIMYQLFLSSLGKVCWGEILCHLSAASLSTREQPVWGPLVRFSDPLGKSVGEPD